MIFRGGLFFFLLIFFSSLEHLNTFLATNITFTSVILAPFYAGYNPCQSNTISRIKINSLVIPVTDIYESICHRYRLRKPARAFHCIAIISHVNKHMRTKDRLATK